MVLRPAIVEATAGRLTAADRARVHRRIAAAVRCRRTTEAVRPRTAAVVATMLAAHPRHTEAEAAEVAAPTVEAVVVDRTAEVAEATPAAVIANLSDLSTENAARKGGVPFSYVPFSYLICPAQPLHASWLLPLSSLRARP
jgi:hypothetical protein